MTDRIDVALAEYNRAIDDYTSIGRWAWGLAVTFGTGVLFNSAEGKAVIGTMERVRQSIGLVILAVAGLIFFVRDARRRVTVGHRMLADPEMCADPRVAWALGGGFRDQTGPWILTLRLMPTVVVLVTYWLMIDDVVCSAATAYDGWHWLTRIRLCK